ncbi:DUF938 domain-containing protein [Thioalkalivibrio sp. HK1]|uniref:DUF938 domain-containing protein n=1 Tax=Thioalkalivibrio sp. HK1 TaxID=1469245 RepID=UPI0004B449FD|nr:DUF938 domain-containing protein [Thioalkalivibrio sp. HK1]
MDKPFAPACERNKEPILEALRRIFAETGRILEIGSGTGQHAVHFAAGLPHAIWMTSDLPDRHPGIRAWLAGANLPNLEAPLTLDVADPSWPISHCDGIFSANTAHIMHWPQVEAMFQGAGNILPPAGRFVLYGPFSRNGRHNSASNVAFDRDLKMRDPMMGIRDIDALESLAHDAGFELEEDIALPANNRILTWQAGAS